MRKRRGLTQKERSLVRNLADGKNLTQSALAAGYSGKCPGQSGWQARENIRQKMPELLDQHGLTDEALIEKHLKPLLNATETKFFQHKGRIRSKREVIAWGPRKEGLDMAFKLKGSYSAKPEGDVNVGVKVVVLDIGRPDRSKFISNPPEEKSIDVKQES